MIKAKKLNELAKAAAEDSLAHGYQDNKKPIYRLFIKAAVEMAEAVNAFRDRRNAGMRSYELDKAAYDLYRGDREHFNELMRANYRAKVSNSVQDEFADVAIYQLVGAGHFGIVFNDEDDKFQLPGEMRPGEDFLLNAGEVISMLVYSNEDFDTETDNKKMQMLMVIRFLEAWMKKMYGQDLEYWIEEKMTYNRLRPFLHGRDNDPTI